jgi:hypothetical protein
MQPTSLGHFVHHPLTGHVSFSDARQTWLTGPGPLLWERRHDERFDWELDASAGPPVPTGWAAPTPLCLPAVESWGFVADGVSASVRNTCDGPRILVLSAELLEGERPALQCIGWMSLDNRDAPAREGTPGALPRRRSVVPQIPVGLLGGEPSN